MTSQTSAGVTTSTYDGDGNLLTSVAPGNQWTTNTWDGENRLTQAALPSGIVDSFVYNGDGQRVQKQDSTGTTNHVWDGQNIVLETNASNIIQAVYTLEPNLYGNLISQSRRRSGLVLPVRRTWFDETAFECRRIPYRQLLIRPVRRYSGEYRANSEFVSVQRAGWLLLGHGLGGLLCPSETLFPSARPLPIAGYANLRAA